MHINSLPLNAIRQTVWHVTRQRTAMFPGFAPVVRVKRLHRSLLPPSLIVGHPSCQALCLGSHD
jgi:hypothetical protein